MKERFLIASLIMTTVLNLATCGGGKAADTTTVLTATKTPADTKAEDKAEEAKAEEAEAEAEAASEKAPEDYKGTVVAYSPRDADLLNTGVNLFMEKYPNVKVEVVVTDTGGLCSRITAETANLITDTLRGGGTDSSVAFKEYFEPHACVNGELTGAVYKGLNGLWIGENPLPIIIFYNKDLIEKDGLIIPETWEDLAKPKWKGRIAYCLPSKSDSAYTQLCIMILGHGDKGDGRDFTEKLYDNLDGKIVDSSGKCHKMVTDDELHVGPVLEKAAVQYKDNPSIGPIYPKDGTNAMPDGVALTKRCPNEENVKLFIDFVTSKGYQTKQSGNWERRLVRSDVEVGEGTAKLEDILPADYDFDWTVNEKEAIIEHSNDIMVD